MGEERTNRNNLMAEQVPLKEERWRLLKSGWLATIVLALSFQPVVSGQQHEDRRGQAWACLHVTQSSEHERSDVRQALTGLQECDGFVMLAVFAHVVILHADHCVVQHRAAVLLN